MRSIYKLLRRGAALAAVAGFALALGVASPVAAIVNGQPDGNRHPNTALIILPDALLCTGVLISPYYVATAAHCVVEFENEGATASDIRVSFDSKPTDKSKWYTGASMTYDQKFFTSGPGMADSHNDFGLIKLSTVVSGVTPANLPALGVIDTLPRNKPVFETAGYGSTGYDNNMFLLPLPFARNYTVLSLSSAAAVTQEYMKLGAAQTGTCFGDSGGPTYLGADIRTVYGLTSYGASPRCSDFDYAQRLDTADAKAFYRAFD